MSSQLITDTFIKVLINISNDFKNNKVKVFTLKRHLNKGGSMVIQPKSTTSRGMSQLMNNAQTAEKMIRTASKYDYKPENSESFMQMFNTLGKALSDIASDVFTINQ